MVKLSKVKLLVENDHDIAVMVHTLNTVLINNNTLQTSPPFTLRVK